MQFYSMKSFNDVGGYRQCKDNLGDIADYSMLSLNLSMVPLAFHFGFCLPKECSQHSFTSTLAPLNEILKTIDLVGHSDDPYINQLYPELRLTKTSEYELTW